MGVDGDKTVDETTSSCGFEGFHQFAMIFDYPYDIAIEKDCKNEFVA